MNTTSRETGEARLVPFPLIPVLILLACASTVLRATEQDYGFKGEYFLSRTPYGDPVCLPFTQNLNQFRKLDFDTCHSRLSKKYPEFTRPVWEEIPFNMALAENVVKSAGSYASSKYSDTRDQAEQIGAQHWQKWEKATEGIRQSGQARMWRLQADIDGDGADEVLIRLLPGDRYPLYGPVSGSLSDWSCDYNVGELYVLEAPNPAVKGQFNSRTRGSDLINFAGNGHYYLLEWLKSSSGGRGVFSPYLQEIGATRGVLIEGIYEGKPPAHISGPVPYCFIDWVPTGRYTPVKPSSRKSTKTPSR